MNGKQRVLGYIHGERVDRVPNLNIVIFFAAKYADIPFGQYAMDYRKQVEANIKTSEDFKFDTVNLMCDPYREVDDFGGEFEYFEDRMPLYKRPLIETVRDIKKLKVFDPGSAKRSLDRLRAIELANRLVGDQYVIYGEIDGPLAVAVLLRGMDKLMMDFYDDPEFVRDLFEIIAEVNIKTVRVQKQAGAVMIQMGEAAASLISADMYEEFVFEYDKKVIDAVRAEGLIPRLHICGNNTHLLEYFPRLGVKIVDLDWMVDLDKARGLFPDDMYISGNLDPVRLYLEGDKRTVRKAVSGLLALKDKRIIVSSGCEIAKHAPHENVMEQYYTLKEIGYAF